MIFNIWIFSSPLFVYFKWFIVINLFMFLFLKRVKPLKIIQRMRNYSFFWYSPSSGEVHAVRAENKEKQREKKREVEDLLTLKKRCLQVKNFFFFPGNYNYPFTYKFSFSISWFRSYLWLNFFEFVLILNSLNNILIQSHFLKSETQPLFKKVNCLKRLIVFSLNISQ